MNTRDDFDELIAARLRAAAPQEAPFHLMNAVIDRVDATPQKGRGAFSFSWLGSPAMRVAAAAVIVAVAIMAGTQLGGFFTRDNVGVGPSGEATPGPSESASASDPSSMPSPTVAATTGDPGELVLRLYAVCDTGPGLQQTPAFTLMADGTVVWLAINDSPDDDGPPQVYMGRRLSAAGLEQMREHIFGSGLFDESAEYRHEPRPGAGDPPGHGACNFTFTAHDGAVVVEATNWFGDEEEETYYQPAPERQALDTLANQLRDPEAIVGADAWASEAAPYESLEYQLVLLPQRDVPGLAQAVDESQVPWPFSEPIDEAGEPGHVIREIESRCLNISRDDAAAIADTINATGASAAFGISQPSTVMLAWAEGNGAVDVAMIPRMPDGYPDCDDPLS